MNNPLLTALLVDGFTVLLFWLIGDQLQRQFGRNVVDFSALTDASIFLAFYACFLIGVHLLRKIRARRPLPPWLMERNRLALIAMPFALVIALAIGDLTSFLDTIFDVNFGDSGNGYYFLVTPAIYLFLALLYFLILIQPTEETLAPTRYGVAALIGIGLFAAALTAYLSAVLPRLLPALASGPSVLLTFVLLLLLLLFPRYLYARKVGGMALLLPNILMLFLLAAVAFR